MSAGAGAGACAGAGRRVGAPRPRRAALPALAALVALALWAVVAHHASSGWVQALGALVFGILALGLLAPAAVVLRARCAIVGSPEDAVAGRPAFVDVAVGSPLELRPVEPAGPRVLSAGQAVVRVELRPERRGVVTEVVMTIASAAPFGLVWWTRTAVLPLPRPMCVAPRTGTSDPSLVETSARARHGEAPAPAVAASGHPVADGEICGVRAYQRGDRQHLVHWRATAHAGTLMVRETARPPEHTVYVNGVLPGDPDIAEQAAEHVMGTVADLLRSGTRVELASLEERGRVLAPVATLSTAGRRLALALPLCTGRTGAGRTGDTQPRAALGRASLGSDVAAPEHSVVLRVAAVGAVCTGIVACASVGEIGGWPAAAGVLLVAAGSAFSYRRRHRQLPIVKAVLALAMVGAFTWFFTSVSASEVGSVLGPLAILFCALLAAHAFDVPARRDLVFSLAGSATLIGVAAAQAIDLGFGLLVAIWAVFVVAGLDAAWRSKVGGANVRHRSVVLAALGALAIAGLALAVLPAPEGPNGGSAGGTSGSGTSGSGSGGGGANGGGEPAARVPAPAGASSAAPASAAQLGVGGYLGFAGPLDTAIRASLGDEVVMRVRADRPTYWIAETFERWSGQSWSESPTSAGGLRITGEPFVVPSGGSPQAAAHGAADYQIFYLSAAGTDLVLHASQAEEIWYPARSLTVAADGTIESKAALGAGSVYTVLSTVATPSAAQLEGANGTAGLTSTARADALQLPHAYPRVEALARRITAGQTTVYGKVVALEHWIGTHTRYTTDIPPLAPGQDTVATFLFQTRRGYCEQISTALAVMLRTLGIPAREATGYVPGPYDPFTDLYEIQANDAHAWVQVWFPGYGWQSFDPTAYVPAANPSPGATIGHDVVAALRHVPLLPTMPIALLAGCAVLLVAWLRRRPATWRAAVTRELERAARRSGVPAAPDETLAAVASRLDALCDSRASPTAAAAERAAWGGREPERAVARGHVRDARRVRRTVAAVSPRAAPARRRSSRRPRAGAGTPSTDVAG